MSNKDKENRMAAKAKEKDNESTKRDCIPHDRKQREEMIEHFIMEKLEKPEKFENGPIVNKHNDPIYIPGEEV